MTHLRPTLCLLALMTVLTGLIYPAFLWGIGQAAFPDQANGSLIYQGDKLVGSRLIGQTFMHDKYFWARPAEPEATPSLFIGSTASNLNPAHPLLREAIKTRIERLDAAHKPFGPAPVDLVTASGSGLDPHISPQAALYQAGRVAQARTLDPVKIESLIQTLVEERTFGFLGERRVNVLVLNLALDLLDEGTPR